MTAHMNAAELSAKLKQLDREQLEFLLYFTHGWCPEGVEAALFAEERTRSATTARLLAAQAKAEPADADRDQPASPDAAGVLAASIAAGTPVQVTDDEPGLCHYCDVEPATEGGYCEACAAAVALATGTSVKAAVTR